MDWESIDDCSESPTDAPGCDADPLSIHQPPPPETTDDADEQKDELRAEEKPLKRAPAPPVDTPPTADLPHDTTDKNQPKPTTAPRARGAGRAPAARACLRDGRVVSKREYLFTVVALLVVVCLLSVVTGGAARRLGDLKRQHRAEKRRWHADRLSFDSFRAELSAVDKRVDRGLARALDDVGRLEERVDRFLEREMAAESPRSGAIARRYDAHHCDDDGWPARQQHLRRRPPPSWGRDAVEESGATDRFDLDGYHQEQGHRQYDHGYHHGHHHGHHHDHGHHQSHHHLERGHHQDRPRWPQPASARAHHHRLAEQQQHVLAALLGHATGLDDRSASTGWRRWPAALGRRSAGDDADQLIASLLGQHSHPRSAGDDAGQLIASLLGGHFERATPRREPPATRPPEPAARQRQQQQQHVARAADDGAARMELAIDEDSGQWFLVDVDASGSESHAPETAPEAPTRPPPPDDGAARMELAIDEDSGQWFLVDVDAPGWGRRAPEAAPETPTRAPPADDDGIAPTVAENPVDEKAVDENPVDEKAVGEKAVDAAVEKERATNASSPAPARPAHAPPVPGHVPSEADTIRLTPRVDAAPAGERASSDPRVPADAPTPMRAVVRQLRRMKIKELRALLERHGEECRTCVEKDDLVGRVLAVIDKPHLPLPPRSA